MLVRYDYNEPCKGKDQCDRECAGLKTILKSYVDSGNNVECANDIFIALNQSKGLKNTKIAVIEIDKAKSSLSGVTILNICSYHSIKFSADCIKFWRYFDVGEGISVPHGNVNFVSGEIIKKSFQSRDENLVVFDKKPDRSNRKIFSLVYCPENGCSESFESVALLEEDVLAGSHKGSAEISSMDRVKQIFIDKMICSAQLHHPYVSSFVEKDNVSFSEVIQNIPLLGTFTNEGWALPVQKSFKYSYKQKNILFVSCREKQLEEK